MKNRKKKILTVLCIVLVSVCAFTFAGRPLAISSASAGNPPAPVSPGTRESRSPASAPEHVLYRQFFRHMIALKERALEFERQGKDGKKLRSYYKDKIGLKDDQARFLDVVADDCEREVAQLDARAKKIIDKSFARYPKGIVPAGESLPPPPPELKELQRQRDYVVMRARKRLQDSFGEYGFRQVDDYLKLNFAPNLRPTPLKPRAGQGQPGVGL